MNMLSQVPQTTDGTALEQRLAQAKPRDLVRAERAVATLREQRTAAAAEHKDALDTYRAAPSTGIPQGNVAATAALLTVADEELRAAREALAIARTAAAPAVLSAAEVELAAAAEGLLRAALEVEAAIRVAAPIARFGQVNGIDLMSTALIGASLPQLVGTLRSAARSLHREVTDRALSGGQ